MELMKLPQIHRMSFGNRFNNYWSPLINHDFFLGRDPYRDNRITKKIKRAPVNINKLDDGYMLEVPLSGYKKEQISLFIDNDVLIIKGEKEDDNEINSKYILKEHDVTGFEHSFQLGKFTDKNKIKASFKNGILSIMLYHINDNAAKDKRKEILIL